MSKINLRRATSALSVMVSIGFVVSITHADPTDGWSIEESRAPEQVSLDREFTEGTWMNLDVSPDGQHIVFDLLGHIYEMPAGGGQARALTSGRSLNLQPRYSPDGTQIMFNSDRDGSEDLWVLERSSGKLTNITRAPDVDRVMSGGWSADGRFLYGTIYKEMALTPYQFDMYGGRQQLMDVGYHVIIANYRDHPRRDQIFFEHLDQQLPASGGRIKIYDKRTGQVSVHVERPGGAVSPAISPDGRQLAYIHRDDVDTQLIVHDLDTREERVVLRGLDRDRQDRYADIHGAYPTMSWLADSRHVVLWHRGGIYSVDIDSGESRQIPFRARVQRSMDKTIRFKLPPQEAQARTRIHRWAQRAGDGILFETLGDLYLKRGNETRNLTHSPAHETSPLYDEASGTLYYASWSDDDLGSIYRQKLNDGRPRKLTTRPSQYGALALSPDRGKLAFLRDDGHLQNGRLLKRSADFELIVLNLKDGKEQRVTDVSWDYGRGVTQLEMPSVSFSADGRRLYFSELINSTVLLERVDLDGREKTELYRFPKASRAEVSPDRRWIGYQEYHRNYLTPFSYIGKPLTVSADDGAGTSLRIDAAHDGLYHRWSPDSRALMWTRGPEFVEKTVDAVVAKNDKIKTTTLAVTFPVDAPRSVIALKGARVITADPDRRVLENATILVRGSRIEAISTAVDIPKGAKVFDLQGRTIMPGIIDAHAHLKDTRSSLNKMSPLGVVEQRAFELHANLAYGVTTLYEVYGTVEKDFWLSDMLLKGSMTGPRMYSVGTAMYGSHKRLERNYRAMDSYEDVLEHVRFNKAFGATALKDYSTPSRRARHQIATAARAEGLNLVIEPALDSHSNLSRLIDGATELAHAIGFTSVYDDYVRMFAANRMGITTTYVVQSDGPSYVIQHTKERIWEDPKLTRFARLDDLRARMRRPQVMFEDELLYPLIGRNLKKLYDAGVPIQAGGHGELIGMDMHFEIEAHVISGFKPMEAIAMATIGNAWDEGLDEQLGSLQPGKLADLIILSANPLEDIRNTRKIELVMKNGVLYSGEDAARVFPDPRPAGDFYFKRSEPSLRGLELQ